jgi:hypothetical protein
MGSFVDEYGVAARSISASQDKMAALPNSSVRRVVAGATHESLLADPNHAAVVNQATHDVVVSGRTSTPLAGR